MSLFRKFFKNKKLIEENRKLKKENIKLQKQLSILKGLPEKFIKIDIEKNNGENVKELCKELCKEIDFEYDLNYNQKIKEKILKFIGIGSCFNYKMGNTSAYYKNGNSMLLIDCGESVFAKLCKLKILNDIEELTILITHLHSDHVGSLSTVIFYAYYALNGVKVNVVYPSKEDIVEKILFLVPSQLYDIYTPEEYSKEVAKYTFKSVLQKHCSDIAAYGYEIVIDGKKIYYSGDTSSIPTEIYNKFLHNEYTEFYQEVSKFQNSAHLYIGDLKRMFKKDRRKDVTCMHLDDDELLKELEKAGFNIPKL